MTIKEFGSHYCLRVAAASDGHINIDWTGLSMTGEQRETRDGQNVFRGIRDALETFSLNNQGCFSIPTSPLRTETICGAKELRWDGPMCSRDGSHSPMSLDKV